MATSSPGVLTPGQEVELAELLRDLVAIVQEQLPIGVQLLELEFVVGRPSDGPDGGDHRR